MPVSATKKLEAPASRAMRSPAKTSGGTASGRDTMYGTCAPAPCTRNVPHVYTAPVTACGDEIRYDSDYKTRAYRLEQQSSHTEPRRPMRRMNRRFLMPECEVEARSRLDPHGDTRVRPTQTNDHRRCWPQNCPCLPPQIDAVPECHRLRERCLLEEYSKWHHHP
jgi:hypothetical protein